MLALLRDLVQHKWHANASLLAAIRRDAAAAQDEELRKLLHHIILANRFWFALTLNRSFSQELETPVPQSFEVLVARYRETQLEELPWVLHVSEADLIASLESPFTPGFTFSVAQALVQVCMHSHGHRAQCATRLRSLGGVPPPMDFIVWLKTRPVPDWS